MLTKKTIGFLGAGNMAEALIKGLLASKRVSAAQITACDKSAERLVHLAEKYEIKLFNKNFEAAKNSDIIFITVKPGDVSSVLKDIAPELTPEKLVISVAAGVTTGAIAAALRSSGFARQVPVIRAMPNTPATVAAGITAVFADVNASDSDVKLATAVFESVGSVITVEDEELMNAVTGLSGSGPAYVFLFMEALCEAGEKLGIGREAAKTLAIQTTLGAARLALDGSVSLHDLIKKVSSPGGTTIEGLKKLDESGFKDAVIKAVEAAAKRAKELSKQ
ncbi:MAG: pyrroline-5-carboxylate reductase [Deltaproteobacteria bacterium]|nr:pyrroline-5-carboxylate reductase [Deltaproteobacteria bacterium]